MQRTTLICFRIGLCVLQLNQMIGLFGRAPPRLTTIRIAHLANGQVDRAVLRGRVDVSRYVRSPSRERRAAATTACVPVEAR
jgi:DNA-binding transcriptional regulator YdaS (Cro superfamily)